MLNPFFSTITLGGAFIAAVKSADQNAPRTSKTK